MARPSLVLDASVGVKWFSAKGESAIAQALAIRDAHIDQQLRIIVPDLFFYEVANAIARKEFIPTTVVQSAVAALFALGLDVQHLDFKLFENSIEFARKHNITIYDSSYIALAISRNCPLVTANPRHQSQSLDCRVIPIEQW